MTDLLTGMMDIARAAGQAILEVYSADDFGVETKSDDSPLTRADMAAHRIIVARLAELAPEIPVLSEESDDISFDIRGKWSRYFLVDPLDGTKEFISRNGEFTVNIALIEDGRPVLGVVFVPVKDMLYSGSNLAVPSAFLIADGHSRAIRARPVDESRPLTIVASRRHGGEALADFMTALEPHFGSFEMTNMGSSLKLCLVAEGRADFYPRLAPTSEWDTAAAQAVVEAAGGAVLDTELRPLRYNTKQSLLNPHFLVLGDPDYRWAELLPGAVATR
jgi:3'(2'), 5'-bisphosphate nucleotidase